MAFVSIDTRIYCVLIDAPDKPNRRLTPVGRDKPNHWEQQLYCIYDTAIR